MREIDDIAKIIEKQGTVIVTHHPSYIYEYQLFAAPSQDIRIWEGDDIIRLNEFNRSIAPNNARIGNAEKYSARLWYLPASVAEVKGYRILILTLPSKETTQNLVDIMNRHDWLLSPEAQSELAPMGLDIWNGIRPEHYVRWAKELKLENQ